MFEAHAETKNSDQQIEIDIMIFGTFSRLSRYKTQKYQVDYVDPKMEDNIDDGCSFDRPARDGKYCPFKIESLDNCSPGKTDKKYGFPMKKPCVYLKLNKVSSFVGFFDVLTCGSVGSGIL